MGEARDATVVERRKPGGTGVAGASGLGIDTPTSATQADAGATSATHASTRAFTYSSPQESMHAEEVMRTRVFLVIVLVLLAAVACVLPLLGGDPAMKKLLIGGMALTFAVCAAFLFYIRIDGNYSAEKAMVPASITVGAAMLACLYFGLCSPAPMVLTFGIYFFSLGASLRASLTVYVAVAGLHLCASLLLSFDYLPDTGLVRIGDVPLLDRIVMFALVQLVLAITFALARLSRRATLTAMTRLEQALRQVGQREALLQEANQDLERALRGGYHGRWSGEVVGRWKLGDVVGRGAMGEVYEGQHVERELQAAVKLLHTDVQADAQQMQRFLREAEVMSQLDSPHVVRVHDVGLGAAGPPFIAMELLRGHDLAWHLRKRRRLAGRRVAELVKQVGSALEKAREVGIVHRDLKPQNLFLAEQDDDSKVWKILDFGVSKLGNKSGTLTRGHVIGTPGYMAPEQARGIAVDHRADVFSLSVIAYRALTGRPAFSGDEYPKIMFDIVYVQPTRPGELMELPADVDLALALGLAKSAEQRFATAAQFADAIADALDSRLSPGLRAQAEDLLARQPWGAKVPDGV